MSDLVLSREDLTQVEVLKDAEAELRRAEVAGDAALADWAKRWGQPAVIALRHLQDEVQDDWGDDE